MPSTTSLWRPELFGAAGTGFKDDPYLTDGQHLRWHVSGHLGLPFESQGQRVGAFRVYHRTGGRKVDQGPGADRRRRRRHLSDL